MQKMKILVSLDMPKRVLGKLKKEPAKPSLHVVSLLKNAVPGRRLKKGSIVDGMYFPEDTFRPERIKVGDYYFSPALFKILPK